MQTRTQTFASEEERLLSATDSRRYTWGQAHLRGNLTSHAMIQPPPLALRNLTYFYPGDEQPALQDITLDVQLGELVALVGPNGAGKSTLLSLIANTLQSYSGEIHLFGETLDKSQQHVAYVPQRDNINWNVPLRVEDVVMMGRYRFLNRWQRPSAEDHTIVEQAMTELSITDLAKKRVRQLSSGQKQRVILARALAQQANIILLDEPLNGLDVLSQESILDVFDELSAQQLSIFVSLHDLSLLRPHFKRVVFIDRTVIADGPTEQVLSVETLKKVYGVRLNEGKSY